MKIKEKPETAVPGRMTVHTRRVEDELGNPRLVFYANERDGECTEWIGVHKNHVVVPKEML